MPHQGLKGKNLNNTDDRRSEQTPKRAAKKLGTKNREICQYVRQMPSTLLMFDKFSLSDSSY